MKIKYKPRNINTYADKEINTIISPFRKKRKKKENGTMHTQKSRIRETETKQSTRQPDAKNKAARQWNKTARDTAKTTNLKKEK